MKEYPSGETFDYTYVRDLSDTDSEKNLRPVATAQIVAGYNVTFEPSE